MSHIAKLTHWNLLLSQHEFINISVQYGPNSQAVLNAFNVLDHTQWLKMVGTQPPKDTEVERVHSWNDAILPLMANPPESKYGFNGHLLQPSDLMEKALKSARYYKWWQQSRADVNKYYNYSPYIPRSLNTEQAEFVWEYLYEYISLLLAEIIAGKSVKTTYFRGMLSWFHAGFFPCGWSGEWPDGKLRVY